jgi:hypothetical protein
MEQVHRGGCRCGAVRYEVRGEPQTIGLCHCADCRRETGSTFLYYADWPLDRFTSTGEFSTWEGRSFCSICGSPVFHLSESHAEIVLGSLDEVPAAFVPTREGWIKRREPWLAPVVGASQHRQDP